VTIHVHPTHRSRPVALFDLDRTLLPGSSLVPVGRVAVRRDLIDIRSLARGLADDALFRRHGIDDDRARRLRSRLLSLGKGRREDEIAELADIATPVIVDDFRPAMRATLDAHRAAGHLCVILSASPDEIVRRVARMAGAHVGLGTRAEIVDGIYTGDLAEPPCHGVGKMRRLRLAMPDLDLRESYGYADSLSDLPVLDAVSVPVAVSPDRRLRAVARHRGWEIFDAKTGRSRQAASAGRGAVASTSR